MSLKEEQIIYVDNKPHIKAKVVMLPINKTSILGDLVISKITKILQIFDSPVGQCNFISQHLYITSDEEIKENSLVLLPNNTIHRMNASDMISYLDSQSKSTKLIIATTQPFMNLPQPSQQFIEKYIEKYNKGNQIVDILVEVEFIVTNEDWSKTPVQLDGYYQLKLDSQNIITIRKQKDSWSRKELPLDALITLRNSLNTPVFKRKFIGSVMSTALKELDKWIEENL